MQIASPTLFARKRCPAAFKRQPTFWSGPRRRRRRWCRLRLLVLSLSILYSFDSRCSRSMTAAALPTHKKLSTLRNTVPTGSVISGLLLKHITATDFYCHEHCRSSLFTCKLCYVGQPPSTRHTDIEIRPSSKRPSTDCKKCVLCYI